MKKLLYVILNFLIISLSLGELSFFSVKISQIFMVVYFISFIIYAAINFKSLKLEKFRVLIIFFITIILLYSVLITIVSGLDDTNRSALFSIVVSLLILLSLVFITDNINDVEKIIFSIIIAFSINILLGYYNIITGNHFTEVDPLHTRYGTKFPLAFFGNPNNYATFIMLSSMITFFSFLAFNKNRIIKLSLIVVSFPLIYASGSRANIFGFYLFIFLMIFFSVFEKKIIMFRKYIVIVGTLLIITGIYLLVYRFDNVLEIYMNLFTSKGNESSDSVRLFLIRDAFLQSVKSYSLGIGVGNSIRLNGINYHNMYLEILVEYGLFVFSIFIYSLFKPFFTIKKIFPKYTYPFYLTFPIIFSIISMSPSSLVRDKIMWIILLMVYMSFTYINNGINTQEIKTKEIING